jgi:hypothetical protein
VLGLVATIRRPQVLTLAVSRDGLQMRGDLSGTGLAEAWLGGHLARLPDDDPEDGPTATSRR